MVHNMYACIDTDYFWICAMIGCNQFVFVLRRLLPRQCKVSCRPPANADEIGSGLSGRQPPRMMTDANI